jgi:3-oxoadipate enol-lactonase
MVKLDSNLRVICEGGGPALILLHCLGVDHRLWDFAGSLGADFSIYRYDLPGHGSSPVPESPYTIEDLSDQLAGIMHQRGIDRASIAGISLGGLIAQDFSARYADKVDKLVLIDTTPRYDDAMRSMWAERAAVARKAGVATMVDTLLSVWFSAAAIAADMAGVKYARAALSAANGEGYALACEALARADLRDKVGLIKAKTLVICGDDDIPSFLEAARWLSTHIEGARLSWIDGARHASVLEQPRSAVQTIQSFLTAA